MAPEVGVPNEPTGDASGSPDQSYEEVTDNQVEGVIEADIIKRSDRYAYYLYNGTVSAYSIAGSDSAKLSTVTLSANEGFYSNARGWEMYLSADCKTLTVILSAREKINYRNSYVELISVDVTKPEEGLTVKNRVKHNVKVGHLVIYVALCIRPADNKLTVIFGKICKERNICAVGQETGLMLNVTRHVGNFIHLRNVNLNIYACGNCIGSVHIQERVDIRTVLLADFVKRLFNSSACYVVCARVGERTVTVVKVEKRVIKNSRGKLGVKPCHVALCLIEISLVLLNLVDYLLIGVARKVNVLCDIFVG
ncbi:MAG: beta-propeller domain-containing protein [Clostridia bacterium]|nr:beta-propeller domain-containing protein [Clostridia bacterium]